MVKLLLTICTGPLCPDQAGAVGGRSGLALCVGTAPGVRALTALALVSVLLQPACRLQAPAFERAAVLAEHGKESEAIGVLEEHLSTHPDAIAERRQLIRLYGSVGRLDRAQQQTERLADILPPNSPIPWVELGHAQELTHHFEEALAAYDHAALVAPNDALGPKTGGLRAAHWGELQQAELRLAEAVRRDPSDAEAWHGLGLVRLGLGQLEPARQAYGSGLHADPESLENRLGLATVALRSEQPEQALREYEALLIARPSYTGAMLGKSWSLILLGRFDAAEAVLRDAQALGADPETVARQRLSIRERQAARTP
jgi:tetratricopeptide (TPR) repeat protein